MCNVGVREHRTCLPVILMMICQMSTMGSPHRERLVLQCLHELQKERGGRHVPTGMLYGSAVEYIDMSIEKMQRILVHLGGQV
jgi:hypothetical protein